MLFSEALIGLAAPAPVSENPWTWGEVIVQLLGKLDCTAEAIDEQVVAWLATLTTLFRAISMAFETRSVPRFRVHWFPRTSPQAGERGSVLLGSKTTLSLSGKVMLKKVSQMK